MRRLVGDVGPSLALLADRLEGRLPKPGALLELRGEFSLTRGRTAKALDVEIPPALLARANVVVE